MTFLLLEFLNFSPAVAVSGVTNYYCYTSCTITLLAAAGVRSQTCSLQRALRQFTALTISPEFSPDLCVAVGVAEEKTECLCPNISFREFAEKFSEVSAM